MIKKVKTPCPPCKNAVIPCDYGDEHSLMEQIAKYKQELKDTIASYKKEIEGLITGLEELDEKVQGLERDNSIIHSDLFEKRDKFYHSTEDGSVYAVKKGEQTAIDVSTTPRKGKIPLYKEAGTLDVNTPIDDSDATPKHYLDVVVSEVQYQLGKQIDGKVNVIPLPVEGTRFYIANASGQGYANGSTGADDKYAVVMRDINGQINLPDQIAYEPVNRQAISKEYADKHYAGGGAKQRILHYFVRIAGYGAGVAYEGDVPLPISSNNDAVYYTVTDSYPSTNYGDINPWATFIRIGDGSVAEASWSTNGVIIKEIGGNDYPPDLTGDTKPRRVYMKLSKETTHAFNTKAEYDAYVSELYDQGFSNVEDQVAYWIEFI